MQTIKLQLEDSLYENICKSGIDIQAKFKEFLSDLVDDGYPYISTQEAKKRVSEAVEEYYANPQKFSELDNSFWDDTEKRLLQRHS
ncbi:MAG: hypothetical protein IE909_12895 [Campylobacterales bacterium]|nr:hypothetical protein [Campylobacterales bacterium]